MRELKEIAEDLMRDKITINQARVEIGCPEIPEGNRKLNLAKNEEIARNLFNDLKERVRARQGKFLEPTCS